MGSRAVEDSSGDHLNDVGSSNSDEQTGHTASPMPSDPAVIQGQHSDIEGRRLACANMISILCPRTFENFRATRSSESLIEDFMCDTLMSSHRAYALYLMVMDRERKLDKVNKEYLVAQRILERAQSLLSESEDQCKTLKESSCKDAKLIQDLEAKCNENDLLMQDLENKVAKLDKEKSSAYADGKKAGSVEVDHKLRKLKQDLESLNESSRAVYKEREALETQCKKKNLVIEQKNSVIEQKNLEIKMLEAILTEEKYKAYADERRAHLEEVELVLHKSREDLEAFKESTCKESEETKVLNAQCKENDLEIKKLKEEVEKLVEEKNKAYADWKQAHLAEVEPIQRKLEKDLKALEESSQELNAQCEVKDLVIKELEKVAAKNRAYANARQALLLQPLLRIYRIF